MRGFARAAGRLLAWSVRRQSEGWRLRSADSKHSTATRKYPECSHPPVGVKPAGRRTMAGVPFVDEVIQ
jgi:hypothetical protein